MKPAMKITNTAGPSPLSDFARSKPQFRQRGVTVRKPVNSGPTPQLGQRPRAPAMKGAAPRSVTRRSLPPAGAEGEVEEGEQEQPDHVDEVPVPGRRLEAEVLGRREAATHQPDQADGQEDRPDDDVEAVEAGGHEEGRAVEARPRGVGAEEQLRGQDVVVLERLD